MCFAYRWNNEQSSDSSHATTSMLVPLPLNLNQCIRKMRSPSLSYRTGPNASRKWKFPCVKIQDLGEHLQAIYLNFFNPCWRKSLSFNAKLWVSISILQSRAAWQSCGMTSAWKVQSSLGSHVRQINRMCNDCCHLANCMRPYKTIIVLIFKIRSLKMSCGFLDTICMIPHGNSHGMKFQKRPVKKSIQKSASFPLVGPSTFHREQA